MRSVLSCKTIPDSNKHFSPHTGGLHVCSPKVKPKCLDRQLVADCSLGDKPRPSMFVDHTDSCISRLFWLHFLIVGGSGAVSSIFIYSLCYRLYVLVLLVCLSNRSIMTNRYVACAPDASDFDECTQQLFIYEEVGESFKNFFVVRGGERGMRGRGMRTRGGERGLPEVMARLNSTSLWKICSTRQTTSPRKVFIMAWRGGRAP